VLGADPLADITINPELERFLCEQAYSCNHKFAPLEWLRELEPATIRQLHIVGFSCQNGRYTDDHSQPVQEELLDLARVIIDYAPVEAIILERDTDFPGADGMNAEVAKLEALCPKLIPCFLEYAPNHWPAGNKTEVLDTRDFVQHLREQHNAAIALSEINRIRFVLGTRRISIHYLARVRLRNRERRAMQVFLRLASGRWNEYVFYFSL